MQPLGRAFMVPFKTYYAQAIETWLKQNIYRTVSHYRIAKLLGEAYKKAATVATSENGFRKTGLFPLNRNIFEDHEFVALEATSNSELDIQQSALSSIPSTVVSDDNQQPGPSNTQRRTVATIQQAVSSNIHQKIVAEDSGSSSPHPSGSPKLMPIHISPLPSIKPKTQTLGVDGELLVNNEVRQNNLFRKRSCYIMQDDRLEPLLTTHEAMTIASHLRLSSHFSLVEKKVKVEEILTSVSLWDKRKTRTGCLSGGEKKRLSIALELLKNPQVMIFDEPTSGLDSLTSRHCVELLRQLAVTGRTVIISVHQPSATIFEMFDHLYVLGKGRCVYQGSVKGLLPYLEQANLRCPPYHNPADYLLEVVSGEYGDYTDMLSNKAQNGVNQDWRKKQRNVIEVGTGNISAEDAKSTSCDKYEDSSFCHDTYPISFCKQLTVLLKRTFIILSRDKTLTFSRLMTHSLIAIFMGILYYGIGVDASNMINNFNFMFFTVMFLMMTAFNCVTTTFPSELPIVAKEHFNKWYSLKSYYLAKTLADVPIQMTATIIYALVTYFLTKQPLETHRLLLYLFMCLLISLIAQSYGLFIGACMDVTNGVIFGPFAFLPFTIFSGFFVQLNDSHPSLRWIFHISFLRYGFEGLVLSVLGYNRGKMPCNADYCHFVYPQKFLSEKDMENADYWFAVYFMLGLFLSIRIMAYFALKFKIMYSRQRR